MPSTSFLQALLPILGSVAAYPQYGPPGHAPPSHPQIQPYIAPGPHDARAPCPALNTLANHGYINRNGKNIERQSIIDAMDAQFGILESAIDLALTNAFTVCQHVTGASCGTTLTNLTVLAEPHAFEHDHSFSREDYMMGYLPKTTKFSDNQNFNATIFQQSLDVVKGKTHVNYQEMNQIRLQRESLSFKGTRPGWFEESKPIQEFEAGFIFAIMGDFNLPDYATTPKVRIEWWNYWFHNESFPYPLGWHPPTSKRGVDFMMSASSAVLAAKITSTPSPLPSGAIGAAPPPPSLNFDGVTTTYQIPTFRPYAAKGVKHNDKRAVATTFKNPYMETLALSDIANQQAYAHARMQATPAPAA